MFYLASFLGALFIIFQDFILKKCDFGIPFEASRITDGAQNRPSGAKMLQILSDAESLCVSHKRPAFGTTFGALVAAILIHC